MQYLKPTSIFITGASSGIGHALALAYAEPGISLFLCGRNRVRLEHTADRCRGQGADVHTFLFDVTDESAVVQAIEQADAIRPLDLVIANAGVSAGVLGMDETPVSHRTIFQTNIFGVLNTVMPAVDVMKRRHRGQIAIMSSLSGFRGMASCPAYSASKACVRTWGEALRGFLKPYGIAVSVICPGFIETPLTDKNRFKMPFLMPADRAAAIIRRRLRRAPILIAFPWIMAFGARLAGILPGWLILPILGRLPKKEK